MSEIEGNVAIIRSQESVVTRGIAKKLKEIGCEIISTDEYANEIKPVIDAVALVIIYLSQDTDDSESEMRYMKNTIDFLNKNGKKVIMIGEKRQLEGLSKECAIIKNYVWLERPVDMDILSREVKKMLNPEVLIEETKKVLLIDDDDMFGNMVCEWLRDDFEMNYVSSGVHAITYLTKNSADLILLDFEMPITDGPQVLEMLRSDPEMAEIPVVFLTGVNSKEQVSRVISLKPAGYVLKNIARDDLIQYIRGIFIKLDDEKLNKR